MSATVDATPNGQDDSGDMLHVEFLYFATCPNTPHALALLREALQAEGVRSEVEMIAVETEEAARRHNFFGSPTIRIEGVDISPPPSASAVPSLTCRLYRQEDGRLATHPPAEAIRQAIHRAQRRTGS